MYIHIGRSYNYVNQWHLIMMVQRSYLDRMITQYVYGMWILVNVSSHWKVIHSVNSVAFNHDGTKIVSGSWDKTIRVWNVDTGECIVTLEGHTDSVNQWHLIMMVQRSYLDRMIKQYVYGMWILVNVSSHWKVIQVMSGQWHLIMMVQRLYRMDLVNVY